MRHYLPGGAVRLPAPPRPKASPQEKLARLQAVVDEEVAELRRLGQKKRAAHLHYLAQIATRD